MERALCFKGEVVDRNSLFMCLPVIIRNFHKQIQHSYNKDYEHVIMTEALDILRKKVFSLSSKTGLYNLFDFHIYPKLDFK